MNLENFGGKPIVRGRRLAVEHVLGMLGAGDSFETLLEDCDWLEEEDRSSVDLACAPFDSFVQLRLSYDGDCDGDGILDACELALGLEPDANGNGVPDPCE